MSDYIPQAIGAAIALIGAGLGAWFQHYLGLKQFRTQQQWSAREKHYMELLGHFSKVQLNMRVLSEYFMEPDSEYSDYSKVPDFKHADRLVRTSLAAIKELTGPARVFLSTQAIKALEDLDMKQYDAGMDAVNYADYVDAIGKLIDKAEAEVLAAARAHLGT